PRRGGGTCQRAAPRARGRTLVGASGESHVYHVGAWKGVVVSFAVGVFSSLFGIGGGIIHVPFLIVALSLPVHVATATSHFVLSISSLVGAGTFYLLGHVQMRAVAVVGGGGLVGAPIGARASLRAGRGLIRLILAGMLSLVGLRMILNALMSHWGSW